MCGICGFTISPELRGVDPDAPPKRDGVRFDVDETLSSMCDIIAHRGPDGEGRLVTDEIALGHRRLSLIDLAGGAQPMSRDGELCADLTTSNNEGRICEAKRYSIVFNGEIYNFRDIREQLVGKGYSFATDSDTEVLLISYIEWGERCLDKLRGMYAFAIWDSSCRELFCARDPFGIKPFYYSFTGDGSFVFASETKSILEHPSIERKLNVKALERYMSFQYSVLDETFFTGIYKLPAAHLMRVRIGKNCKAIVTSPKRWWDPTYEIDETMDVKKAAPIIHETIQDSVRYHKIADVEVGSFLSSGVDSNYLAASLNDQEANIKTFTVGFDTADGHKYNEIDYAHEAAEWMGVEHISHAITPEEFWEEFPKIQWHMDEPSADPAAAALWFVDKEAAKHVKAILSGEGADELFGGYQIYQTPLSNDKLSFVPKPILRASSSVLGTLGIRGANYLHRVATPMERQFIGNAYIFDDEERYEYLRNDLEGLAHTSVYDVVAPTYEKVEDEDDVTKMQFIDLNHWLVGDILLKTDKMAMAHSLESRVPFLDREVWKVARTLPRNSKVNQKTTKLALRSAAETIMPARFCEKAKLGFPVPIRVWLKEDGYYDIVRAAFESENAKRYFDTDKLVELLDEHRSGKADNSRKIWTVYSFLVWYDQYF